MRFRSFIRFAALLLLATFTIAPAPVSADFESGVAAYDRGEFANAFHRWLPLAEEGHVGAQFNIAQIYRLGKGIEPDLDEALKWYMRAAEGDNPNAYLLLGHMYETGTGVEVDRIEAYKWYELAARQRHNKANDLRNALAKELSIFEVNDALLRIRAYEKARLERRQTAPAKRYDKDIEAPDEERSN